LKLDQAKRLKKLEKREFEARGLVAELSGEKQILKDVAEGNFLSAGRRETRAREVPGE
jgi:putative transposase